MSYPMVTINGILLEDYKFHKDYGIMLIEINTKDIIDPDSEKAFTISFREIILYGSGFYNGNVFMPKSILVSGNNICQK